MRSLAVVLGNKVFKIPVSSIGDWCVFVAVFACGNRYLPKLIETIRHPYQVLTGSSAKNEALTLLANLDDLKRSLQRAQEYSTNLGDITKLKVIKASKPAAYGEQPTSKHKYFHLNELLFQNIFGRIRGLGYATHQGTLDLQSLLLNLSQRKSLLSSIPSSSPSVGRISSGFGPRISPFTGGRVMHLGVDIVAPIGTPVHAPADGVVIFNGIKGGFGNFIMIAHGYGLVTRYGHNSRSLVQVGQLIKRGDQIAAVGLTGRSTGPHLHYEIVIDGRPVNPKGFIVDMPE
jgi:murein DD-endopeptidase MepM/ murein hydrolase activator NlpD